jgi:hypothetical protein
MTAIQTNRWSVIDATLAVANRPRLRQKRSKLAQAGHRQVFRRGFARVTVAERSTLADGPR